MKTKNIQMKFKGFIFVSVLLLMIQGISIAQESKAEPPVTLDGHKFIINSRLGSPFVNTTYTNFMGVGQTLNIRFPEVRFLGIKINEIRGELFFTMLSFEYQQQIRDWMAFRGKFDVYGRLGTEAGALISQGVDLATGYELSWKFKLFQTRKIVMSTSLFMTRQSYTAVDLDSFIRNILDSLKFTRDNKLIRTVPLLRGGIGINGVFAINKTFGITAGFGLDYGESFQRKDADVWNYHYGLGLDADLYPVQEVPIGFLAGFRHYDVPETKESTSNKPNSFIFQINYTGNESLNIGTELYYIWYKPQKFDDYIKTFNISLMTSMFF